MRRFVVAVIAVAVLVGGCVGESPTTTLTGEEQAVVDRINRMTNCADLQEQFDIADARNKVVYMEAAHDRMKDVGCYG